MKCFSIYSGDEMTVVTLLVSAVTEPNSTVTSLNRDESPFRSAVYRNLEANEAISVQYNGLHPGDVYYLDDLPNRLPQQVRVSMYITHCSLLPEVKTSRVFWFM